MGCSSASRRRMCPRDRLYGSLAAMDGGRLRDSHPLEMVGSEVGHISSGDLDGLILMVGHCDGCERFDYDC